jgi:hypothetical protein
VGVTAFADDIRTGVASGSFETFTISGLTANTTYTIEARATATGKTVSGTVSQQFTTDPPPPQQVWVQSTETNFEVQLSLGLVSTCPTVQQALAELEAAFPAAQQNVGDRGAVFATKFENEALEICDAVTFKVVLQ